MPAGSTSPAAAMPPGGGDAPRPPQPRPAGTPLPAGYLPPPRANKGTAWRRLFGGLLPYLQWHRSALSSRKDKIRNIKGSSVWDCLPLFFFLLFPGPVGAISQRQKPHLLKLKHWILFILSSPCLSVYNSQFCFILRFAQGEISLWHTIFSLMSEITCPIFCLAWPERCVTSWSKKKCYRADFPSLSAQRWRADISNPLNNYHILSKKINFPVCIPMCKWLEVLIYYFW